MSTTHDTLKKLAWDVDDYRNLHERGLDILQRLTLVSNTLDASSLPPDTTINAIPDVNILRILSTLRPVLLAFETDVLKKRRKPARDVLVLQISESTRRRKPYAIPVHCIPHSGLHDAQVRNFSDELKKEMRKAGLKPQGRIFSNYVISIIMVLPFYVLFHSGLVTDGEFNSLCCRGTTRPISIMQIRSDRVTNT